MPQAVLAQGVDSWDADESKVRRTPVPGNFPCGQVTGFKKHTAVQIERAIVDDGLEDQVAILPGTRIRNP